MPAQFTQLNPLLHLFNRGSIALCAQPKANLTGAANLMFFIEHNTEQGSNVDLTPFSFEAVKAYSYAKDVDTLLRPSVKQRIGGNSTI